jgi:hypothetical protein
MASGKDRAMEGRPSSWIELGYRTDGCIVQSQSKNGRGLLFLFGFFLLWGLEVKPDKLILKCIHRTKLEEIHHSREDSGELVQGELSLLAELNEMQRQTVPG